jgi:hypothetical protein
LLGLHVHCVVDPPHAIGVRPVELVVADDQRVRVKRQRDLAAGRLRVRYSKTDAGSRYVDLLPVLRDELSAHKAASANVAPNAYVFPSAASTRQDGGPVRGRVLGKAIKRANAQLAADGQTPLPEGLTLPTRCVAPARPCWSRSARTRAT